MYVCMMRVYTCVTVCMVVMKYGRIENRRMDVLCIWIRVSEHGLEPAFGSS
jgi:hypothetical protein